MPGTVCVAVNNTSIPSLKFDVALPPFESRYQHWKFHVSPGCTATAPPGCGIKVTSAMTWTIPVTPEFGITPPTSRPIGLPRQRLPALPAWFMSNPCVRLQRKYAAAFSGRPELVSTRLFKCTTALPEPEITAGAPVEFATAGVQ